MENNKIREFNMPEGNLFKKLKYIFGFIGAGSVLMSAVMGPGTLAASISAGSNFGYSLLWVIILGGIMNGVVSYVGGKIACITGKSVYEYFADKYGKVFTTVLLCLVLTTWALVILSQGAAMLQIVEFFVGAPGTIAIIAFIIVELVAGYFFTSGNVTVNKLASYMVTIVSLLLLINVFVVKPDMVEVGKGLIPRIPPLAQAAVITGIIGGSAPGTSAAWYSISVKKSGYTHPDNLRFIAWDQIYFSFVFIVFSAGAFLSAAAVLNPMGIIPSSTLDAAISLEPLVGSMAKWIFALGFFGALFTTVGGMSNLFSEGINQIKTINSSSNTENTSNRVVWLGILISIAGGLVIKGSIMKVLVSFIGLLNLGGFIIIFLLTKDLRNKEFAGKYRNGIILTIFSCLAVILNGYAVINYVLKFIK
ncbi:Nramp family divalent metal transporter [Neofamilia massiliensis]|uniref:Nramp family divalent metal transporter n=1 Tax=Neofamilia massiliensis TaxID=1673724 RepID=UPI0006BB6A3B|nr:Nramp family divalent metal transporter [Neofamilia massiliensis]